MTLTTAPPDEATAAAHARHDLVVAYIDAGIYIETHPGARLPKSPVSNIPVEGKTREEKVADLRAIAASWDVPVTTLPDGTLYAELRFGPLTFEAHVMPDVRGTVAWLAMARRQAGTGTAA